MNRALRRLFIFFFLILAVSGRAATKEEPKLSVLFIGNGQISIDPATNKSGPGSVCNKTVERLRGKANVRCHTRGATSLKEFFEDDKLRTKEAVKNQKWDYLVLQGRVLEPSEHKNNTKQYAIKLVDLAKTSNSPNVTVIVYQPQPRLEKRPKESWQALKDELDDLVRSLRQQKFHVRLVPVGEHVFISNKADKKFYNGNSYPSAETVKYAVDRLEAFIT
jgi:hypothetical protein